MAAVVQREAGTKGAVDGRGSPHVTLGGEFSPGWVAVPGEPCQEQQPQVSYMAMLQEGHGKKCLQAAI